MSQLDRELVLLIRIRVTGARRCTSDRTASRYAWRGRGEDPAGEGSVTCVQRRVCGGQPDLREDQELVRAEEADRACVSDVRRYVLSYVQRVDACSSARS